MFSAPPLPVPTAAVLAVAALFPVHAQDIVVGDPAIGRDLYVDYCAACHGEDARGNGPMADVLSIPPADLTTLAARNGGAFPTSRVAAQIDGRDPLLAHGGEMPIFGDFFQGLDTAIKAETGQPMMTSRPIVDLIEWLKGLQAGG